MILRAIRTLLSTFKYLKVTSLGYVRHPTCYLMVMPLNSVYFIIPLII